MYENFEDVEEHDFKVLVVGEVAVGRHASHTFAACCILASF